MTGVNPEAFCTTDSDQNFKSVGPHNFQGGRGGGSFLIHHTGTLDGGDFTITSIDLILDTLIIPPLQEFSMFVAESFHSYTFDTVQAQSNPVGSTTKNIPAMGGLGLLSLCLSMLGLGTTMGRRK